MGSKICVCGLNLETVKRNKNDNLSVVSIWVLVDFSLIRLLDGRTTEEIVNQGFSTVWNYYLVSRVKPVDSSWSQLN